VLGQARIFLAVVVATFLVVGCSVVVEVTGVVGGSWVVTGIGHDILTFKVNLKS